MAGGNPDLLPFTFTDIYNFLVVLIAIWIAGKFISRFGLPSLCGEIVVGIVIGECYVGAAAV